MDFQLFIRAYWAKVAVADGSWTPVVDEGAPTGLVEGGPK
jgi:hypothetical protein